MAHQGDLSRTRPALLAAPLLAAGLGGTYQVRVIGLTAGIVPLGTFSDALTVTVP
jgi:hypothetical protein